MSEKEYTEKEIQEVSKKFFEMLFGMVENRQKEQKKDNEIKSKENIEEWIKNNSDGIFQIKVWYNAAETSRDADDICTIDEKYFSNVNSAIEYMKKYVEESFCNAGCFRIVDGLLICSDICSWGRIIELKRIEVEK